MLFKNNYQVRPLIEDRFDRSYSFRSIDNHWRIQEFSWGAITASAERKPQSGLGALHPVKSRGKAPGGGQGASPLPGADDMFALLDYICELVLTPITSY